MDPDYKYVVSDAIEHLASHYLDRAIVAAREMHAAKTQADGQRALLTSVEMIGSVRSLLVLKNSL